MTSLGQIWSNYITQNDESNDVKPVTSNESVVNQNNDNEEALKYQNYKKGILQGIINGGKLNNEPATSQ